jgi:hypothetical protein
MAVAIFDHQPSPGELLERRIERGWRPTPTATRDGNVILGYAACRVPIASTPIDRDSRGLADREFSRQDDHVFGRDR